MEGIPMTLLVDRWDIHPEHRWLRGSRPEQPVQYDERLGTWNVYGYPEVIEVLGDPRTFSSDTAHLFPVTVDPSLSEGDMSQVDPPEHRKLRTLVSRAFTPKIVADLAPRITALTHELLDAMAASDQVELVADLAYPLPVTVIAELLGVPSSDRHLFKQWADKIIEGTSGFAFLEGGEAGQRGIDTALENVRQLLEYLRGHAVERRRRPRQDLLTHLVEAEVDGARLSDNEVVNIANILLVTGHITTTMLLGNAVLCLDAHPDEAERVRRDRSLVPTAIEESLRLLSPSALIVRATTTDVDLGGRPVPRDQALMVWLGAANRDERQFSRPEVFDPGRDPNPHVGFGRGIHFCLGAPLARLEGRIALNLLLDRFPQLRTDPDDPPTFFPSPDIIGVSTLPLRTG
jgi:cytochrome P450